MYVMDVWHGETVIENTISCREYSTHADPLFKAGRILQISDQCVLRFHNYLPIEFYVYM